MKNLDIVCLGVSLSELFLHLFISECGTDCVATIKGWKDLIQQEMSWMDSVSLSLHWSSVG